MLICILDYIDFSDIEDLASSMIDPEILCPWKFVYVRMIRVLFFTIFFGVFLIKKRKKII